MASATHSPPVPSLVIERGDLKPLLPVPWDPKARRQLPVSAASTAIRLLSVSATYGLPSEPTPTSRGRFRAVPEQVVWAHSWEPSALDRATTRWLEVSAT